MKFNNFLLYEFKISLQLTKKFKTIIDIATKIKNKNANIKQNMIWWDQMFGSWSQILHYSKI
jgi:hypothetical protein